MSGEVQLKVGQTYELELDAPNCRIHWTNVTIIMLTVSGPDWIHLVTSEFSLEVNPQYLSARKL